MKTSSTPCVYFTKHGHCAKGRYCTFSHDTKERPVCTFFKSAQGCKYGSNCAYLHSVKAKESPLRSAPVSKPSPTPVAAAAIAPTPPKKNIWGFDDAEDVYFYGASGTFSEASSSAPRNYAAAIGNEFAEPGCSSVKKTSTTDDPNTVCAFYLSGNCRFGAACRYLHPAIDSEDVSDVIPRPNAPECGICLAPIESQQIGMLSHCDCVYCLECIRSWRKDGRTISKADQVRLCPLCRHESYFIIPCSSLVNSRLLKMQLIESYKANLRKTPCKYYREGSCPFSTSCFYLHIDAEGNIEETTPPRVLLDGSEEIKYMPTYQLRDFVGSVGASR